MFESQIKEIEKREKTMVKAYMLLCLVVLISVSLYTGVKIREYITLKTGIEVNSELISILRTEASADKASYEINRVRSDEIISEIEKKLVTLFPIDDDYTNLTRQIDKIEEDLNKINDPFEISNIDYLSVVEEGGSSILPIRMNIQSSRENFTRFLHIIENSGALNEGLRLMDISSIRMNFREPASAGEKTMINFSVLINAYFQSGPR